MKFRNVSRNTPYNVHVVSAGTILHAKFPIYREYPLEAIQLGKLTIPEVVNRIRGPTALE